MVKSHLYMQKYREKIKQAVSTGGSSIKLPKQMDVSQFAGMSLQEIEDRIRNLDHEELFVIDKDGNITAAYTGGNGSVSFYSSDLDIVGATVTHGHPKGGEGYGATFSLKDVQNMASSKWNEHRATASGQGEMNYIIRATSKTTGKNRKDLYDRIESDKSMLNAEMDKASKSAGNVSATAKRQIYTGILDKYYSKILPQYNFEYIKRKDPYNYNR